MQQLSCGHSEAPGVSSATAFALWSEKSGGTSNLPVCRIISAAPVIHHAGLLGLAALDVGLTRKADEEIPTCWNLPACWRGCRPRTKGTEENYRWLGVDWPENRAILERQICF
jgi:hypothetical protein